MIKTSQIHVHLIYYTHTILQYNIKDDINYIYSKTTHIHTNFRKLHIKYQFSSIVPVILPHVLNQRIPN